MRNIARGPCQIDLVKLSLLHPHFLRCRSRVEVSKHMRFLINSSIGIETKSFTNSWISVMGFCAFWHIHFRFSCLLGSLQLEAIRASMPSSTTKVTKPLRLVLFLSYRMSRFLGFCFTKIYPNSPSGWDLFLRYPYFRCRHRHSREKLGRSHNKR